MGCMKLCLYLLIPITLIGQSISFSPQQVSTKRGSLMLWNVDVNCPGRDFITAAEIYAIAVAHGVGHMDGNLAGQILASQASKSAAAIIVEILGWSGAGTAVVSVIKNGGVVTTGAAAKIQNAAVVLAGAAAIVQLQLRPEVKQPTPPIGLLGPVLTLVNGSGSALFYSLPSQVQPFTDKVVPHE